MASAYNNNNNNRSMYTSKFIKPKFEENLLFRCQLLMLHGYSQYSVTHVTIFRVLPFGSDKVYLNFLFIIRLTVIQMKRNNTGSNIECKMA